MKEIFINLEIIFICFPEIYIYNRSIPQVKQNLSVLTKGILADYFSINSVNNSMSPFAALLHIQQQVHALMWEFWETKKAVRG